MLEVIDLLGRKDLSYEAVWKIQKERVDQVARQEAEEALILVEHESVITAGRRSRSENILNHELPVYEIERGGDVTWHGPGQLVIYPILRLYGEFFTKGLNEYLRFCEQVVIDVLSDYGVDAGRYGETGVWIKSQGKTLKIASIGVAVRRWVTYHGISLNVENSANSFSSIRPCNFESSIMTNLRDLKINLSLEEVKADFLNRFCSEGSRRRRRVS